MQNTYHSPGTWSRAIKDNCPSNSDTETVIVSGDKTICALREVKGKNGQLNKIEQEANERLIMMAPDLLQLAIEIKEALSILSESKPLSIFEAAILQEATELVNRVTK